MRRESWQPEVEITVAPQPPPPPPPPLRPFRKWSSWLVPAIIVANLALFFVTMYINNCPRNSPSGKCLGSRVLGRFSFQPLKENPLFGPSATTLEKMGALEVYEMVHRHQGWRLMTCIWLHAGVVHILANMLSLLFIGIKLEEEFGFVRIGLLYIISGLGGSLLSALFIQSSISVGASGVLFGLLGAMLSELITNWSIYVNKDFYWDLCFSYAHSLNGLDKSMLEIIQATRNTSTNSISIYYVLLLPFF